MPVTAEAVSVGTTAVQLSTDSNRGGSSLLVQAPAAAILYVGGPDVDTTDGFPIPAGTSLSVDLPSNEFLYGRLASGTGTAQVLRIGA